MTHDDSVYETQADARANTPLTNYRFVAVPGGWMVEAA